MKRFSFFLSLLLTLSACGLLPPAPTPTPTLTLTPTRTPTATLTPSPTATFTPTTTPAPSLPEIAAADFARYNLPTEGLQFETGADGVTRAIDPETGEVVYEDGKFDLRFTVEHLTDLMPTKYGPKTDRPGKRPTDEARNEYLRPLYQRARDMIHRIYNLDPAVKNQITNSDIMLDPKILAWGKVIWIEKGSGSVTNETPRCLLFENSAGEIVIILMMQNFNTMDVAEFWAGQE